MHLRNIPFRTLAAAMLLAGVWLVERTAGVSLLPF